MDNALSELEALKDKHVIFGQKTIALANEKIFPCHALYLSVLNRSLEVLDGFLLLNKNGNYGCCMALLRIQLDNILRFYGVLLTKDPHRTANSIRQGKQLNKIKDKNGKFLKDYYLVKALSKQNDWVSRVYKLSSGYIHLSDQHVFQMLERTEVADNGDRNFYIGSDDGHIDDKHKLELVKAFTVITLGIFKLFNEWECLSKGYDESALEKEYELHV